LFSGWEKACGSGSERCVWQDEAAQRTYEPLWMTREHYDLYEWLKP